MTTYHASHFTFELPGRWRDRSINVLRGPDMSVVITRDRLPRASISLVDHLDERLATLAQALPGYRLIARQTRIVPPLHGYEVMFEWLRGSAHTYQQQVYLPYYSHLLIITANSLSAARERCRTSLDALLATAQFRQRG